MRDELTSAAWPKMGFREWLEKYTSCACREGLPCDRQDNHTVCGWCSESAAPIVGKDDEGRPVCEFCADDYRSECDTEGEMP